MSAVTASLCSTLLFVVLVFADQKIITAKSGQDVTLTCRAPDDSKIIVVNWTRADLQDKHVLLYRTDHFVPHNQHPSFKNRVDLQDRQMKDGDVSLILKDVTIIDTGTYECHVYMAETDSWKSINTIYLRVDPPEKKPIVAVPEDDVTLPCRAPNNKVRLVEWRRADLGDKYMLLYQDDTFDPDNQHPSFKNRVDLQDRQMKDGDVSLILKDVTINDAGTYECRVLMADSHSWKHTIIKLRVVTPDQKIITANSGQDVTLTCRAPDDSKIIVVNWTRADLQDKHVLLYRTDHFVPHNQHPSFKNRVDLQDRQMKDGDVSLILKDVKTADDGTYECHVYMAETDSWELISIINLFVVPPVQKTIPVKSGQNVTLTCRAPNDNIILVDWSRADLGDKYVLLHRDGQFVPDDQHPSFKNRVDLQDRQMKDGDVSLILKDVKMDDTGTYVCRVYVTGKNRRKRDVDPISKIYLSVDPPGLTGGSAGLTAFGLLLVAAGATTTTTASVVI